MRALPALLGILLALLLLLVMRSGALAGQTLRIGDRRIPLSPTQPAPPFACPDLARPVCVVALTARPANGGGFVSGTIINSGAQPVAFGPGSIAIVGAAGGALTITLDDPVLLPERAHTFGGVSEGLPPGTPLTLVVTVPGLPVIAQEVAWLN